MATVNWTRDVAHRFAQAPGMAPEVLAKLFKAEVVVTPTLEKYVGACNATYVRL